MSTEDQRLTRQPEAGEYRQRLDPLTFSRVDTAEAAQGTPAAARYWGVACRTCGELVPFDACPYLSFGDPTESMKPGAIRCSQGHNHIYFPRDFQFLPSAVAIAEDVMRRNRETYHAINPSFPRHKGVWLVSPEAAPEIESPAAEPAKKDAQPEELDRWTARMERQAV